MELWKHFQCKFNFFHYVIIMKITKSVFLSDTFNINLILKKTSLV